jgi:hypothetical protein
MIRIMQMRIIASLEPVPQARKAIGRGVMR